MRFDVVIRRGERGTTHFVQEADDLIEAVVVSKDEHKRVWGSPGEVVHAELRDWSGR